MQAADAVLLNRWAAMPATMVTARNFNFTLVTSG